MAVTTFTGAGKSQQCFFYVDLSCGTCSCAWSHQLSKEKGCTRKTGGNKQHPFKWRWDFLVASDPSQPTLGVVFTSPHTCRWPKAVGARPLQTLRIDLSVLSNWTARPTPPGWPAGKSQEEGTKEKRGHFIAGARGHTSEKGPEESSARERYTGRHRGAPGKRATEQGGPRCETCCPGRAAGHLFNTTIPSCGTAVASRYSHCPQAGKGTGRQRRPFHGHLQLDAPLQEELGKTGDHT